MLKTQNKMYEYFLHFREAAESKKLTLFWGLESQGDHDYYPDIHIPYLILGETFLKDVERDGYQFRITIL